VHLLVEGRRSSALARRLGARAPLTEDEWIKNVGDDRRRDADAGTEYKSDEESGTNGHRTERPHSALESNGR
jgi:hypothetical protein